eukprot:286861-Alexandrium_andersonii.AAC.1
MSASLVGSEMCIRDSLRTLSDLCSALDLEAQPQGYRLRNPKARGYLLGEFLQAGRALDWAEKQFEPFSEAKQREAASLLVGFDVAQ